MSFALEVNNLKKAYGGFYLDISFSIESGETLAIVGANGAGKTTLIQAIQNLVRRDAGDVRFFGLDLDSDETEIKQRLGVFLEDPRLFAELSVEKLLAFYSSFYPSWDNEYALRLLQEFEVDSRKRFKKLSKGMKVKAALTLALAPRPSMLILDEPTSGLDPKMRRLFVEKVREARRLFSPAILLTSHIMRDVEDLADRIAFLERGRIRLLEPRFALQRWRVVEGLCERALPFKPERMRFKAEGESIAFKLLADDYGDGLLERLEDYGAVVTGVSTPDLEEIYDWIMRGEATPEAEISSLKLERQG
ncbi:MAG TPA: ABC transporter ATP-binding protein, partial [Blastocatellia bacterium]|nr:ABC transporter ATP-binding protein [Blastocatellia bacterium]